MGIVGSGWTPTHAELLQDHLARAGLSVSRGARALRVHDRTLRRYCSGKVEIPVDVLLAASRLPPLDRKLEVMRLLDAGRLSPGDKALTKGELLENSKKLRKALDYLLGRVKRL
jgi:hypothetical protein